MTKIIPRGTSIPTKKSQVFSTAVDNQPAGKDTILLRDLTINIIFSNDPSVRRRKGSHERQPPPRSICAFWNTSSSSRRASNRGYIQPRREWNPRSDRFRPRNVSLPPILMETLISNRLLCLNAEENRRRSLFKRVDWAPEKSKEWSKKPRSTQKRTRCNTSAWEV